MEVTTVDSQRFEASVDKSLCASSGACVASAPDVFEFDDDEESTVIGGQAPIDASTLREIAFNCPAGAIRVEEVAS